MEGLLGSHGYPALFLVSLLAASVVPMGSEWLLSAMVVQGFALWPVVATATVGNFLGASTTYLLGIYGGPFLIGKILRIDAGARQRAEKLFQRYGSWALLFSWLPIVGDPLCLVGGLFRISFPHFFVLVIVGKFCRYAILALLVQAGAGLSL